MNTLTSAYAAKWSLSGRTKGTESSRNTRSVALEARIRNGGAGTATSKSMSTFRDSWTIKATGLCSVLSARAGMDRKASQTSWCSPVCSVTMNLRRFTSTRQKVR